MIVPNIIRLRNYVWKKRTHPILYYILYYLYIIIYILLCIYIICIYILYYVISNIFILSLFPTMPMLFSISQLFLCFCNLCSTPPHSRWPPAWASANSCAALCGDPVHPSSLLGFRWVTRGDSFALKFALRYGRLWEFHQICWRELRSLWMTCWDVLRSVYRMVVWISTWLDLYGDGQTLSEIT
jgi:hypothetical protein